MDVTLVTNNKQGFFSTAYTQDISKLGSGWSTCSYQLPMNVVPRPTIPDGYITDLDGLKNLNSEMEFISNPDQNYELEGKTEFYHLVHPLDGRVIRTCTSPDGLIQYIAKSNHLRDEIKYAVKFSSPSFDRNSGVLVGFIENLKYQSSKSE